MSINTTTLGGLPILDPPQGHFGPAVNWFERGSGGGPRDAGYGQFLMRRADYNTLKSTGFPPSNFSNGNPGIAPEVRLSMTGAPGTGFELDVYIMGCTPFSTAMADLNIVPTGSAGDVTFAADDVVLVIVRDTTSVQPHYPPSPLIGGSSPASPQQVGVAINVQEEGFPYKDSTHPIFRTNSLNSTSGYIEYTWQYVVETTLGLHALPAYPTWNPRNMLLQGTLGDGYQQVCDQLFLVCGWFYVTSGHRTLLGLRAYAPDSLDTDNSTLLNRAAPYRIAGASADRARRLPKYIWLQFPAFVRTVPGSAATTSQFYNLGYLTPNPDAEFRGLSSEVLQVQGHVMVGATSGSPPIDGIGTARYEGSLFADIAADLGERRYNWIKPVSAQYEFAGIWPFHGDGRIRRVLWQSGPNGATTSVKFNDASPFHRLPAPAGALGAGGIPVMYPNHYPHTASLDVARVLQRDDRTGSLITFGTQYPMVLCDVTSTKSVGGVYGGTCFVPESLSWNGSALSKPGDGDSIPAVDCIIINDGEYGLPTHQLLLGASVTYTYPRLIGMVIGFSNESTPLPIVRVYSQRNKTGSAGLLNSPTKNWARDVVTSGDNLGDGAISFPVISRIVAGGSTGQMTYYSRSLGVDAGGNVISVGAEDAGTTITVPP